MSEAYFERLGESRFRATEHTSGAWEVSEQHIAPALGLLAHCVERDRDARRDDGLVLARLSYDILGTVPVGDVDVSTAVLRPGRTIDLVEATMTYADRAVVRARAWLMARSDTSSIAGGRLPTIPGPDAVAPWEVRSVWPGGFIEGVEVRRGQVEPGRAVVWVRTPIPLVAGEPVGAASRFAGLLDIANGMTVRADPREVLFPNIDLTAHLFRRPEGAWAGFDITVTFGADGIGLTSSVLHDVTGPLGTQAQLLTLRPRRP
ncbi:MAG: thioesterase family protein [Dermatophilaceae bacterium]